MFYVELVTVQRPDKLEEDYMRRKPDFLGKGSRNIALADLFCDKSDMPMLGHCVMMVGSAGVGKSTVTYKLAYDWANDQMWKEKYNMVFHFRCRDLADISSENYSAFELLTKVHSPDMCTSEMDTNNFQQHITNRRATILIVIDGLDEMPSWIERVLQKKEIGIHDRRNIPELINGLITGTLLRGVKVLATTRPQECLSRLKNMRNVLILGFNESSIYKCLEMICTDSNLQQVEYKNKQIHEEIVKYLDTHSQMMYICVVPFFCTLFGILATENLLLSDKIGIENYTQLMIYGIRHLLTRRLETNTIDQADSRDAELLEWNITEGHQTNIKKHASLAAKGCLRSDNKLKLMFSSFDIVEQDIRTAENVGLLEHIREQATVKQAREYYYFMHLTIQEFLAAVHVCLTWKEEDVILLSKVDPKSRTLDNIQLFTAGLLGDKDMGHGFLKELSTEESNLSTIIANQQSEFLNKLSTQNGNSKLGKLQLIRLVQ